MKQLISTRLREMASRYDYEDRPLLIEAAEALERHLLARLEEESSAPTEALPIECTLEIRQHLEGKTGVAFIESWKALNVPTTAASGEAVMAAPIVTYETMTREELIRECKNKQAVIEWWCKQELTLRDRMAIEVLPAIYQMHSMFTCRAAELAYEQADELIKRREPQHGPTLSTKEK